MINKDYLMRIVDQLAKVIANKLNIYDEIFEIAGRVHDIGYCRDKRNHAEHSLKLLKERGYEVDEVLADCILNHGNAKSPTTTEGRIFQLADKLSIFDEDILEILIKNTDFPYEKEAVDFLKEMAEKTFRMLEKF